MTDQRCDTCGAPVTQNVHGEIWHTPAALDRVKAEARREGMLRAAEIVDQLRKQRTHSDEYLGTIRTSNLVRPERAAAAIRAEAKKEPG